MVIKLNVNKILEQQVFSGVVEGMRQIAQAAEEKNTYYQEDPDRMISVIATCVLINLGEVLVLNNDELEVVEPVGEVPNNVVAGDFKNEL